MSVLIGRLLFCARSRSSPHHYRRGPHLLRSLAAMASAAASSVNLASLETRLFINNEFVNSKSGKTFKTLNPFTEEVIAEVQEADEADVNDAVAAATAAFEEGSAWRTTPASGRRDLLLKLAALIEVLSSRALISVSLVTTAGVGSQWA